VKFKSTEGISVNDSLYISDNGKLTPVLKVNGLSSVSCVCTALSAVNLSVTQVIIAKKRIVSDKSQVAEMEKSITEIPLPGVPVDSVINQSYSNSLKQRINGSISAYSYSNFSNTPGANSTSLQYTISLDARNIMNSRFSIESYVSFRHKPGDWSEVRSDVFKALKIYDLDVVYDLNKTTQISLGRKINSRISSIGSMDGLQVEKSINKFSIGAVVGSRPKDSDYGFNGKLFQYGAYLAYNSKPDDSYSETSLAFMQQMNNSKTDRRFLYFQHSSSLLKNIFFFSTFEVDLFKLKNNVPLNTMDLTSLYLSLRVKMTKNLTLTGSYDERKNVLFYETYKTLIDSVLDNEKRQSIRVQLNYRLADNLILGIESGYRFLRSDPHPSRNLYGYLSYYQIPWLKISLTLSATLLESNYLNGNVFGADISRDLFKGKFQTSLGYRHLDYSYNESLLKTIQNIGEINLSLLLFKKMSLSINYEGTFEKQDKYNRLFLQIRERF
jgi:hypothetical protein